jgi:hypothetical protein
MNQPTWQDLPKEIQEEMLNEQERQGNKRDAGVFIEDISHNNLLKGFNWEGHEKLKYEEWKEILHEGNFAPFYEKFPKKDHDTIAWDDPVEMLVWEEGIRPVKKEVYGMFKGQFSTLDETGCYTTYTYAKPILPTINWDEFKDGDVVEFEHASSNYIGYLKEQDLSSFVICSDSSLSYRHGFLKSNIKSIRKLK